MKKKKKEQTRLMEMTYAKEFGGKQEEERERKKEDYFGGEGWKFNIQYLERKMAVSELSFKFNVNCRRKIICLRCRC